jgi:hypothetical protein
MDQNANDVEVRACTYPEVDLVEAAEEAFRRRRKCADEDAALG